MAEYIEREAVMQAFHDYVWHSNHSDFVPTPRWNDAVSIVSDIPAADVVPVRHGRWMSHYGTEYVEAVKVSDFGSVSQEVSCSECGAYLGGSAEYEVKGNYCPNCGAKMDKDGDGDG